MFSANEALEAYDLAIGPDLRLVIEAQLSVPDISVMR